MRLVICILALVVIVLSPYVSAQYIYGDIYVESDGNVRFDVQSDSDLGIVELSVGDERITGETELLTKKENGEWTFNIGNSISYEYIFLDLHLPTNLRFIRSISGLDNILDINGKIITIVDNDKELDFEVKYSLFREENYALSYFFGGFILLLVLVLVLYYKKSKNGKSRLDYILPMVNDSEKLIIENLMKRNYRQKELRKKLEIPKASFARYMINLEKKKLIVRDGEGKNKVVRLK